MKEKHPHWLKNSLVKVAKFQLVLVIIYIAQIIAYDSSKLITPEVLLWRWYAVAGVAIVSVAVLFLAKSKIVHPNHFKILTILLVLADIAFAAFNVYTQRGMSSRAVALFFIPIIISAILLSRVALYSTAILCVIVYTTTAVAYFVNYFNEGYKIELYGEIFFYSGLFLISAGMLWSVIKSKRHA